jgi:hypothetical protein
VKFINDPNQHQLEFQQLPTSYLRLAAHRVAQHYSLQSMVLLDGSLPDSSGSRIIVHKTSGCKPPLIRLADIPVKLQSEENTVKKVAIKQRPQKQSLVLSDANSNSVKNRNSKSVKRERKSIVRLVLGSLVQAIMVVPWVESQNVSQGRRRTLYSVPRMFLGLKINLLLCLMSVPVGCWLSLPQITVGLEVG